MSTEKETPRNLYKLDGEQGTSEIWRKQTELEKERMKKKTNTTICQLSNHTSGWGHVHISATSNKAEAYGTSNAWGLSTYDILATKNIDRVKKRGKIRFHRIELPLQFEISVGQYLFVNLWSIFN